jgi:hypothetical protein
MNQTCKDHSGHEARIKELENKIKQLYIWVYTGTGAALFLLGKIVTTYVMEHLTK